jgi:predicted transcriptional regulator
MRLKGLTLQRESEQTGAAMDKTVGDLMREPIAPLRETATFRQIADRFLVSSNNFLPVVDARQQFIGVVALQDLKEFLNTNQSFDGVIAYDLMRLPSYGTWQLFFHDRNGAKVELDFDPAETAPTA